MNTNENNKNKLHNLNSMNYGFIPRSCMRKQKTSL